MNDDTVKVLAETLHAIGDGHYDIRCTTARIHDGDATAILAALPAAYSPEKLRRVLAKVVTEFDYWVSNPRPAIDGGTVRLHNFSEVQQPMERVLDAARALLSEGHDAEAEL